jgi:hypothetical protein
LTRHSDPDAAADDAAFRVIALISSYNEGDIISVVLQHLIENGVHVYLIDNESTDDTVRQASQWLGKGLLGIESFVQPRDPADPRRGYFAWEDILRRKEQLASELRADWFIHHDADEVREGPWPDRSLRDAIRVVDGLGYNCINFQTLNFRPVDDGFRQGHDPRSYFRYYEPPGWFDSFQRKCWKAAAGPVCLTMFGGHEALLPDRRVFPVPFILRHYPVRSQRHGVRKVLGERIGRFLPTERAAGWHRQYDSVHDASHPFIADASTLRSFDLDLLRRELLAAAPVAELRLPSWGAPALVRGRAPRPAAAATSGPETRVPVGGM